jgi:hypothetical protein
MEQPTACRPTREEIQSATCFHKRNPGSSRSPSRTAHRRRRAARLRQIGGGQPSRRPIAGGPQSSRASLDRSGAARLARLIAGTSRQSPALLRRDLRPAKPPWAFDHRALRASWRSTIRPSRPKRSQSGRGTEEQGMTGDANGNQETGPTWRFPETRRSAAISKFRPWAPGGQELSRAIRTLAGATGARQAPRRGATVRPPVPCAPSRLPRPAPRR